MKEDYKIHLTNKIFTLLAQVVTAVTVVAVVWIVVSSLERVLLHRYYLMACVFLAVMVWQLFEFNKKKIRQMSDHSKALEKQLDPDVTSSGLTKGGSTNPQDK